MVTMLRSHQGGLACQETPYNVRILLVNPKVPKIVPRICRYGRPRNMENPKPHQRLCRVEKVDHHQYRVVFLR